MKLSPVLVCLLSVGVNLLAQAPPPPQATIPTLAGPGNPLAPGQKLIEQGKFDEARAYFNNALQENQNPWDAYLGLGSILDLEGDYDRAQDQFEKAIDVAPFDRKSQAVRALAISYAFQGKADEAAKYEQQAFDWQMARRQYTQAAGIADELARIYLECGEYQNAYKWYETGHETALKDTKLSPSDQDLWAFRWENAQARIAARRGQKDQAAQHAAAAKAIIDKGGNADQAQFVPYMMGYVAYYGGDYKRAIAELQKANQKDPFILVLLGQAYEQSGDKQQAMEYYRKVLQINSHNPTNAFARPIAKQKLDEGA